MVMVPSLEMSLWVFVWDERDLHACVLGVSLDMVLFLFSIERWRYLLGYGCFVARNVLLRGWSLSGMRLDTRGQRICFLHYPQPVLSRSPPHSLLLTGLNILHRSWPSSNNYRYATAAKMAANKTPSALCCLLLNLPSDSLVDAASPAPLSLTFDTVAVVDVTCVLACVAAAVSIPVVEAAPETSPPKLLAAALASEYKLCAPTVTSENMLPTAEVA
jgi:hypothetical protein